jgi:hypothetical protein
MQSDTKAFQPNTEWNDSENGNGLAASATIPPMSAIVKGKDASFSPWSERADVTSLSSSGVSVFMATPCIGGRLVSLILSMPDELRRYDNDKRLYRIWGLVQYCYKAGGEDPGFHVGIALIGKVAPDSYQNDPMQSFRVCGMRKNGLWKVEELDSSFTQRSSTRFWESIEVQISRLDEELRSLSTETAVTENISESGSSVFSDQRVTVGDRVKFQTRTPRFTSLAIVRDRRIGLDNRTRIHLEFVDNQFPVLKLPTREAKKQEN